MHPPKEKRFLQSDTLDKGKGSEHNRYCVAQNKSKQLEHGVFMNMNTPNHISLSIANPLVIIFAIWMLCTGFPIETMGQPASSDTPADSTSSSNASPDLAVPTPDSTGNPEDKWQYTYLPRIKEGFRNGNGRYEIQWEQVRVTNRQTGVVHTQRVIRTISIQLKDDPYPYLIMNRTRALAEIEGRMVTRIYYPFNYPDPNINMQTNDILYEAQSGDRFNLTEQEVIELYEFIIDYNPVTGRFEGYNSLVAYARPIFIETEYRRQRGLVTERDLERLDALNTNDVFQMQGFEAVESQQEILDTFSTWYPQSIILEGEVGRVFLKLYRARNGGSFVSDYYDLVREAVPGVIEVKPGHWIGFDGAKQWMIYRAKQLAKYIAENPDLSIQRGTPPPNAFVGGTGEYIVLQGLQTAGLEGE
jgi:hypothetical protein